MEPWSPSSQATSRLRSVSSAAVAKPPRPSVESTRGAGEPSPPRPAFGRVNRVAGVAEPVGEQHVARAVDGHGRSDRPYPEGSVARLRRLLRGPEVPAAAGDRDAEPAFGCAGVQHQRGGGAGGCQLGRGESAHERASHRAPPRVAPERPPGPARRATSSVRANATVALPRSSSATVGSPNTELFNRCTGPSSERAPRGPRRLDRASACVEHSAYAGSTAGPRTMSLQPPG